ncbi:MULTISPECIES: hypothetical protein [Vibrio]|nr:MULTISPECIES: hypothetical protein [Vibrio]MBF4251910.1 hypothetical protein [Vibrio anguillarum]MBF4386542.1 hypothetical protein [Vibrio anguillarum]MBF4403073.1 hypothetical protein [Vibrio anguillarum]MBF4427457.1 hypothetical protein [Vibrio anguillarum]TQP63990.1 hypothetical protein FLL81_01050 [Vibrio cholerae]
MAAKLNLNNQQVSAICKIIVTWSDDEKLTWLRLTKEIKARVSLSVTRQTLCKYFSIKHEYDLRKEAQRAGESAGRNPPTSATESDLRKEIARLQREVSQLERKNNAQIVALNRAKMNAAKHHPPILPHVLFRAPVEEDRE